MASGNGLLARVRRNTAISCAAIALFALALDPERPRAALGVLGGGVLVAISYVAIARTIGVFMPAAGAPIAANRRRKRALALLFFASHYALLAFAAYVMIARLRLHPIGLLGGVTSIVLAVAAEAVRPAGHR